MDINSRVFYVSFISLLRIIASAPRCDFLRLDASSLSNDEFRQRFRLSAPGEPVVLTGLNLGRGHEALASEALVKNFGNVLVDTQHVVAYRAGKPGQGPLQTGLGEAVKLEALLGSRDSTLYLLKPEHKAMATVAQDLSLPGILEPLQQLGPTLSIGGRNASSPFHQHHENWFAQLEGRKAWVVGASDLDGSTLKAHGTHPCMEHEAKKIRAGLKRCVLREREVLYLPSQWHHGTCNVADVSLGVGYIGALDHLPELHFNAALGNIEKLVALAPSRKALGASDKDGKKPLHWASNRGHVPTVKRLLQLRASTTAVEVNGAEPLHFAAFDGHLGVVRVLLQNSGSVNARTHEQAQPLHLAASRGHTAVAGHLLKRTAEPSAKDSKGAEPLHMAAYEGHSKIADLLLARKASAHARTADGTTPAKLALGRKHEKLATKLKGFSSSNAEL